MTPSEPTIFRPSIFPPAVVAGVTGRPWSFGGPGTTAEQAAYARAELARRVRATAASLVFPDQVHGSRVIRVPTTDTEPADGLLTDTPGLYLCLRIADCCAVLVHDESRRAVGAFHAGWRGARDGIVGCGLDAMTRIWGTRPQDLTACLSPCASGERYAGGPGGGRAIPSIHPRLPGRKRAPGSCARAYPSAMRSGRSPGPDRSLRGVHHGGPEVPFAPQGRPGGRPDGRVHRPTHPARVCPPDG